MARSSENGMKYRTERCLLSGVFVLVSFRCFNRLALEMNIQILAHHLCKMCNILQIKKRVTL